MADEQDEAGDVSPVKNFLIDEACDKISRMNSLPKLQKIIDLDDRKGAVEAAQKRLAELEGEDHGARSARSTAGKKVWQVEIPNCLLGKQFVLASSEAEALEKYTTPSGITSYALPPIIAVTPLDPNDLPEGVELFGEPVEDVDEPGE